VFIHRYLQLVEGNNAPTRYKIVRLLVKYLFELSLSNRVEFFAIEKEYREEGISAFWIDVQLSEEPFQVV
jgi:hypothetical protein